MIEVTKEGILLEKTDLDFENEGVLNPAIIREGEDVHVFYRAVRKGNNSTIGYCKLKGPMKVVNRLDHPVIKPEYDYESRGVEDGRIVKINNLYYLTYTGYDGVNARGALAVTKDLVNFRKIGVIVPAITCGEFIAITESAGMIHEDYFRNPKFNYKLTDAEKKNMLWDKNLVFFPRKINEKFVFLHRIRPGIQIAAVEDLDMLSNGYWDSYFHSFHEHIVIDPVYLHESSYVGGGCPPIETEHGWLMIHHGVERKENGLIYSACAALLDLNDPVRVLARLPYPLFSPKYEWELKGEVNNVVFPTGTALFGDKLFIYYGAADTVIACASVSLSGLVDELLNYKTSDEKRFKFKATQGN